MWTVFYMTYVQDFKLNFCIEDGIILLKEGIGLIILNPNLPDNESTYKAVGKCAYYRATQLIDERFNGCPPLWNRISPRYRREMNRRVAERMLICLVVNRIGLEFTCQEKCLSSSSSEVQSRGENKIAVVALLCVSAKLVDKASSNFLFVDEFKKSFGNVGSGYAVVGGKKIPRTQEELHRALLSSSLFSVREKTFLSSDINFLET
ncbi:hypothetical protein BDF21DRAFT_456030 [Thamnidium elegans]|nr:hypothetical protein BDF21DRAFT_456030 [Thamnidium elegans]